MIVIDSTGRSASRREKAYVIDPFNMTKSGESASFNPLDVLDPESEGTLVKADAIVAAMIASPPGGHDAYWEHAAQQVIRLVLLHVLTAAEYEGRRTLTSVRELITHGEWAAEVAANNAFGLLLTRASSFMSMGPKQLSGITQTALEQTGFIDTVEIQRATSHSDFTLADLKTASASLYLFLPRHLLNSHGGWLRIMLTTMILDLPHGNQPLLYVDQAAREAVAGIIDRAAPLGLKVRDY